MATKLGEPHAWLGFIPYVQTYTFVKCGGKSGWWVLWITIGYMALIIPGVILTLMVMHGISKRYGRGGGTTALFFFFPYVMLPVLAFSDVTATPGNGTAAGYAPAYAPNSYAAPAVVLVTVAATETMPVTTPAPDSIFVPESSAVTISVESSETPASPSTDVNPVAKESETVVDNGPGFKLPGA